eukprot:g34132.t1
MSASPPLPPPRSSKERWKTHQPSPEGWDDRQRVTRMADDFKSKARRLESTLNSKLSTYSSLPDEIRRLSKPSTERKKTDDAANNTASLARTLKKEIEEVLAQLSSLLERMEASPDASNLQFMLQRYHSILNQGRDEFYRTQTVLSQELQRLELFEGADLNGSSSLRPRTETLLREKKGVEDSIRATDEAIAIAIEAKSQIVSQGNTFSSITEHITNINQTFPRVGGLINSITRYKNRDMLVMATVMSLCFFFTIWYIWTVK